MAPDTSGREEMLLGMLEVYGGTDEAPLPAVDEWDERWYFLRTR